jgi:hypothetical protein
VEATGDSSCDQYHSYKEDIAILKRLNQKSYRLFDVMGPGSATQSLKSARTAAAISTCPMKAAVFPTTAHRLSP